MTRINGDHSPLMDRTMGYKPPNTRSSVYKAKYRLLSILIALSANMMRFFTLLHEFISQTVHRKCTTSRSFFLAQLVAFFLLRPIFKLSNLCFASSYMFQLRRMRLIGGLPRKL